MFAPGQIVKLKFRNAEYPLFVLVTSDWEPADDKGIELFSGSVLVNELKGRVTVHYRGLPAGTHSIGWNTQHFELSSWKELKKWI